MSVLTSSAVIATLSVGLGLMLLASSISKLRDEQRFVVTVGAYEVVPEPLTSAVARGLPVAELAVGLLLITGTVSRIAGVSTCLLCMAFAIAVAINVLRRREIYCGCFGNRGNRKISVKLVGGDVALAGAGLLIGMASPTWQSAADWSLAYEFGVSTIAGVVLCLAVTTATLLGIHIFGTREKHVIGDRRQRRETWP